MSASQISPACGIVVESLVFRGVTVQEALVVAQNWRLPCGSWVVGRTGTRPLLKPGKKLLKIFRRELLDGALDLFNSVQGGYVSGDLCPTQAGSWLCRDVALCSRSQPLLNFFLIIVVDEDENDQDNSQGEATGDAIDRLQFPDVEDRCAAQRAVQHRQSDSTGCTLIFENDLDFFTLWYKVTSWNRTGRRTICGSSGL
jgi:hypothetical protein